MKSRLTNKEFQTRLTDLTRIGEPTIMGTPFSVLTVFDFSGKPFYGVFDETKFRLARNKVFPLPTGYTVDGSYSQSGNGTILNYEVKPITFSYYWIRVLPIVFFIFINVVLFLNLKTIQLDIVLTLNGFVLLMGVSAITVDKLQKKRIGKRFQEEFEVEYQIPSKQCVLQGWVRGPQNFRYLYGDCHGRSGTMWPRFSA